MRTTSSQKLKQNALGRVYRAFVRGRTWRGSIYWRASFSWDGREVLVAAVPSRTLSLIERNETTVDTVASSMALTSISKNSLRDFAAYKPLWEEAIVYALGVRQDAKAAEVAGTYAVQQAELGNWFVAYQAARQAYEYENAHANRGWYWHLLLYTLVDLLLEFGYEREYPELQSYTEEAHRNPSARHDGRRGLERGYSRWKQSNHG